jgi:FkbM family methyltransferase
MDDLSEAFRALPEHERLAFLGRNLEHIPDQFFFRVHGRWARRGRLDYPNVDLYLRVTSKLERKMRLRSCSKEPWTVEWIERWVKPGEVFFDIGANVGAYSLIAAKGSKARVFAFEPGYANFAALCENIVLNDVAERITPLPVGLAARTSLATFSYRNVRSGFASHALRLQPPTNGGAAAYQQPVLAHALDDLVERFSLPRPNHVKLDVDGAEVAVLAGAVRTLRAPELRSLMIEVEWKHSETVTQRLAECGLTQRSKFERRNGRPMKVWYGLFTPVGSVWPFPEFDQPLDLAEHDRCDPHVQAGRPHEPRDEAPAPLVRDFGRR